VYKRRRGVNWAIRRIASLETKTAAACRPTVGSSHGRRMGWDGMVFGRIFRLSLCHTRIYFILFSPCYAYVLFQATTFLFYSNLFSGRCLSLSLSVEMRRMLILKIQYNNNNVP
jgi:hypothetical protein